MRGKASPSTPCRNSGGPALHPGLLGLYLGWIPVILPGILAGCAGPRWPGSSLEHGAVSTGTAPPPAPAESARTLSDNRITAALTPRLFDYGPGFPGELGLTVRDGIVTLTGFARNPRVKARAIAEAESTRGVKGVIDRIEVRPMIRLSDSRLARHVRRALTEDPGTPRLKVRVSVVDGRVTLRGVAATASMKNLAIWVAEGVEGVRDVRDQLRIAGRAPPPDPRLAASVRDRFRSDPALGSSPIEVRAFQGKVALLGRVPSGDALRAAVHDAWESGALEVVVTGLQVDPFLGGSPGGGTPGFRISDFELWNALDTALEEDPRLRAGRQVQTPHPRIRVRDGVVTLSGEVDSPLARDAAVEDASLIRGVIGVNDRLQVEGAPVPARIGPDRSARDDAMEARIYSMLNADPEIGANDTFEVNVDQGVADLGGIVESWRIHRRFTHDAFLAGAREVVNHLRVRQDPSGSEHRFVYTRDPLAGSRSS